MTAVGQRGSRAPRLAALRRYTRSPEVAAELLAYNENGFDLAGADEPREWPLEDEPHVAAWEEYARLAAEIGADKVLRRVFVQTRFPVCEGMSEDPAYLANSSAAISSCPQTHR